MAKIRVNRQNSALEIPHDDFGALEFDSAREYEITRVKRGIYILTEGTEQKQLQQPAAQQGVPARQAAEPGQQPPLNPIPQHDAVRAKIVKMLSDKKMLPQRVEGRFEKTLNAEELKRFQEMLASGEIEKFRLSPKYKNAVYQLSEKNKGAKSSTVQGTGSQQVTGKTTPSNTEPQAAGVQENNAPNSHQPSAAKPFAADAPQMEPTLDRDGYLIVQNEGLARQISADRAEDIRKGEIMGLRSFEGPFYIIKGVLYTNVRRKIENALEKNKTMTLEALAKELNTEKTVIKIACEFMKEDGSLLEKRRGIYRLC